MNCSVCAKAGITTSAAGRWHVDGGCIVLPWIEDQFLCLQHEHSCEPLGDGGATLVEDLLRCDLSTQCGNCGSTMVPEHAHYKCPSCGFRDSCCDGPY